MTTEKERTCEAIDATWGTIHPVCDEHLPDERRAKGRSEANSPMSPCPECGQNAVMSSGKVRRHPARRRFGDSHREPLCPASGRVIPPDSIGDK